ncbi:hypothetical protein Leryth_005975 [Lithospermum erythrorhizon]|nr:hypothetical protein Leryth_005975 [Lithospermum erythrorhizon]
MVANEFCVCNKIKQLDLCKTCLHQLMYHRLRDAGFNCIICKSKWRDSPEFPAGEHTYLQVLQLSNEGEIKVIIELSFRSEFEIARASEEYNNLIKCLPEVYVGKIERVGALLRLLCAASKKLLKERKMHMAPWRKQKYMEAKWQSGSHHHVKLPQTREMEIARPRASMLTFDFIDGFPGLLSQGIRI